ncbi:MAG TPA: hypothetical protein VJ653_03895 [Acidimicrobiales bacterium]|nr:hypothetical protein [Acidimicrobiales bacterium]
MTVSVGLLRRCFLALAVVATAGTAVELALSRHWTSAIQLIPWYIVGGLAAGALLLMARPRPWAVRAVRVLAVVAVIGAAFGVYEHVLANYHAGPLDFRYESKWSTMSAGSRWWAAISESVGPSPTLAPAVLAQAAACLLFATLGHPALGSGTAANVQRTRSAAKASSNR